MIILLASLSMVKGQEDILARTVTPADTIVLEAVSISVLPFRERYLEATGGVFAVSNQGIDRTFSIASSDLYNLAPGVHMASGSLNTNRLVIRGVGSRTPYNTNRIRAYLDDIPLTSGDGVSTLEDLDLLSIGSMEVLKGPSSALYGSGLGGVIRLNSPYPSDDGFMASLMGEYGSFSSTRVGLTSSYKKGNTAITGGFTSSSTDGYRENSAYIRNNAFLNAHLFGKKHSVSLTLSLVDLYSGIPSSLNETDFVNDPEKAGGSWGTIKGFEEYVKLLSGMRVESQLNNRLTNNFILFSTYADPYERRPFNILDEQTFNLGFREYLAYRLEKMKFSAGVEYFHEWYDWKIFETLPQGQGALQADQSETRRSLNGFAMVQWRPSERILVDAGLNLNLLGYTLTTSYRSDSTDQTGSYNYKPVVSPRIGVSYQHDRQIWTYASAGHGFSAPSLEETLLPEGNINTSLRPETGWNLEMGNRGSLFLGKLGYDLALYAIFLDDLLVTDRIAEDIFTGVNAGKALNTGMEIMLHGDLHPKPADSRFNAGFTLAYSLSKNHFREFIDDGIDYSGNELPGIPRQEINTILLGSYKELRLRIQHIFTGQQWMNDANEDLYNGYQLMHLQLSWFHKFGASPVSATIQAGVRNLFDTHHASMILINAPSFGGNDPRYYYPGSPRQFHLGIKLNLAYK